MKKLIRVLFLVLVFFQSLPSKGQCNFESIPYINEFGYNSPIACFSRYTGSKDVFKSTNKLFFDLQALGGTSILETPYFYLRRNTRLGYSLYHNLDTVQNRGFNDSLLVFIKIKSDTSWTLLKNYNKGFGTYSTSFFPTYENILLDSAFTHDTVCFKFEFYSDPLSASTLEFDNLMVLPNIDSIFKIPFTENFNGNSWQPFNQNLWNNNYYDLDSNWRTQPAHITKTRSFRWVLATDSTALWDTGPSAGRGGIGNYFYSESNYFTHNGETELYTPYFNLDSLGGADLEFWYHMRGKSITGIYVEQTLNNQWVVIDSIYGEKQINGNDPWSKYAISLSPIGLTQFRFRVMKQQKGFAGTTSFNHMAIDDFSIKPTNCPINLNRQPIFTSISANTVTVVWDTGLVVGSYQTKLDTSGFSFSSGIVVNYATNSTQLLNLQENKSYDFYIRKICAAGDSSDWRGPYTFTTECEIKKTPYTETFDDSFIPDCWVVHNQIHATVPNAQWKNTEGNQFPAYGALGKDDYNQNGGYAIGVDGSEPSTLDSIAILSPTIDISNLQEPIARFHIFSNNVDHPEDNNKFSVDVFDGNQWNTDVLVYQADSSNWVELKIPLIIFSGQGIVQFRMVVNKSTINDAWFNDIVIDNFRVEEGKYINCEQDYDFGVENISCNSVELAWDSTNTGSILSKVFIGSKGSNPLLTSSPFQTNKSSITINQLLPNTTYDVFLVDSCMAGYGIDTVSFTTDSLPKPQISTTSFNTASVSNKITYFFDARASTNYDEFYWQLDTNPSINSDTVSYSFITNGIYLISTTAVGSCGSVRDSFEFVINSINLKENVLNSELTIYPNPAFGIIYLRFENFSKGDWKIALLNETGQTYSESIVRIKAKEYIQRLDYNYIPKGIYILKVTDNNGTHYYQKLIIRQ